MPTVFGFAFGGFALSAVEASSVVTTTHGSGGCAADADAAATAAAQITDVTSGRRIGGQRTARLKPNAAGLGSSRLTSSPASGSGEL